MFFNNRATVITLLLIIVVILMMHGTATLRSWFDRLDLIFWIVVVLLAVLSLWGKSDDQRAPQKPTIKMPHSNTQEPEFHNVDILPPKKNEEKDHGAGGPGLRLGFGR